MYLPQHDFAMQRPSWVIEQTLDHIKFNCCGNAKPFPFKCNDCGHAMVLCCECDTLYQSLPDTDQRTVPEWNEWSCPACNAKLPDTFMSLPDYRITFDEWSKLGLDSFIAMPPFSDLQRMLNYSVQRLRTYLERGMRSTANRYSFHLDDLASSMQSAIAGAEDARHQGQQFANDKKLADAVRQCDKISDPDLRTYAIIGIADVLRGDTKNGT